MPRPYSGRPLLPLVIFEFIGGAWDGMNLSNHSPDPIEAGLAVYVMQATQRGQPGQCVTMPVQYAIRNGDSTYEVTAHNTLHGESLVRLEVREGDGEVQPGADGKTIILFFSGGCLDGQSLRSDSGDLAEALLTAAYFGLIRQGSPCECLQIFPAVWRRLQNKACDHRSVAEYRVAGRIEDEQTITVRLDHLPYRV